MKRQRREPPAAGGDVNGAADGSAAAAAGGDPVERRRKALVKAKGLVARAAHASTPEEEARSSALIAARFIHAENLLDAEPRHPIFERLDGLDDDTLDVVAGRMEELISGWPAELRRGSSAKRSADLEAVRWRAEAQMSRARLFEHAHALRYVLETGRIGIADKPDRCLACGRPILRGEMIAWKRRRGDSVHYTCFIEHMMREARARGRA